MEKTLAKIKLEKTRDHLKKAFMSRLIKAIEGFDFFELFSIDTAVASVDIAGLAHLIGRSTGKGCCRSRCRGMIPFQHLNHLFNWSARHKLNHREGNQQNTE